MTGGGDVMTSLPKEVSSQIFSYLDARSLVACCHVNKGWSEIADHVHSEIWFRACVDADILVNSDKYENATEWKVFLSSMIQRKNDMQTSACFGIAHSPVKFPLKAIYYHKGKIAVAFSDRIEVRIVNEERLYREFKCNFEATFLKFDDKILLSGSTQGIVLLWCIRSGKMVRNYSHDGEIPTSFDFLTDYDIFVKSFFKKGVFLTGFRVRSLSDQKVVKKLILKPQSLIVSVLLSPHPDYAVNEQQKKCYLFCLTLDYVCVSTLTLHSSTILYQIVASHNFTIPFDLQISNEIIYKHTGGLRFDGENLYILVPFLSASNYGIFQWDLRRNYAVYIQDNQIVSLLGVGELYLAYEFKTKENVECIRITHKISREIVATINLPRRHRLTDDFLCLGETSWLDGLNGGNDSGIVCAFIAEDEINVNYIKFLPRRNEDF